jgi:hypothetical protein
MPQVEGELIKSNVYKCSETMLRENGRGKLVRALSCFGHACKQLRPLIDSLEKCFGH